MEASVGDIKLTGTPEEVASAIVALNLSNGEKVSYKAEKHEERRFVDTIIKRTVQQSVVHLEHPYMARGSIGQLFSKPK